MKQIKENIAVVLVNLGTPKQPTTSAIRNFLKRFLSDRRVVDLPSLIWFPILYGFVLPFRPKKLIDNYRSIWLDNGKSPLIHYSENIQSELENRLQIPVKFAMSYTDPNIVQVLDDCYQEKIDNIIILPMYPQYSSSTTGSVFDTISRYYMKKKYLPQLFFIRNYHTSSAYIDAIAQKIVDFWQEHGKPEKLVFSFHGVPTKLIEQGDLYQQHCEQTTELIVNKLNLDQEEWVLCYQSRFGKTPWITPYTDETVEKIAKEGVQSIHVISPAFVTDCLETLEEIEEEICEIFIEAGGKTFKYIPCLNDDNANIALLQSVIEEKTPFGFSHS